MRVHIALFLAFFLLLTSACQAEVCPPNSVSYVTDPTVFPAIAFPNEDRSTPTPSLVKIGGKTIEVDRVIQGPLCNDTWSGTVYVACNVQVAEWSADEENPTFLKNCNLNIEPGTVVYVAAHNDTAYYNGCSCHTEGVPK